MLELMGVSKIYKEKNNNVLKAMDNVNLIFDEFGLVFIIGKSGSGKTTLLNLLGGIDKPSNGEISIYGTRFSDFNNKDYDNYRNTFTGFVFQDYLIFENLTVEENLKLALELQNKKYNQELIDECLKKVDLIEEKYRLAKNLSGGQKQRVSIARALIKNPKVIFADEPTGNLDFETGEQIYNIFKYLSKEILIIIVSHDNNGAGKYGDRIIELQDGKVINDSLTKKTAFNNKELHFIKGIMPLKYAIMFGLNSFLSKVKNMVLTTLIILVTLMFFTVSLMYKEIPNQNDLDISLQKSNIPYTNIMKNSNNERYFTYDNAISIQNKYRSTYDPALVFSSGVNFVSYSNTSNSNKYYYYANPQSDIIVLNESFVNFYETKLTENSRLPVDKNEIVISNYMAEQYLRFGYQYVVRDETTFEILNTTDYIITDIEEILDKEINLTNYGYGILKIVGIVNYDTFIYDDIKEYNPKTLSLSDISSFENNDTLLYDFSYASSFLTSIVVSNEFANEHFRSDEGYYLSLLIPDDISLLYTLNDNLISDFATTTSTIQENYQATINNILIYSDFAYYLSIIFGIYGMILIYSFLKKIIEVDTRKIGVLRAIGSSKFGIAKIYLMQNIFWIIMVGILVIVFGFLAQFLASLIPTITTTTFFGVQYIMTSPIFSIGIYFVVVLLFSAAVFLATIIPIIKITARPIPKLLKYIK